MSTSNENSTGLTLALVGGSALLLWFLWPGRGKGSGQGGGKGEGEGGDGARSSVPAAVVVRIRGGDQVELDGVSSDLATTVARARAAGAAHVFATGDARQGWVTTVTDALKAAGVVVYTSPSLPNAPRTDGTPGTLVPRNARTSRIAGGRIPVEAHERRWPRHGA
jgi:hypothetical protein